MKSPILFFVLMFLVLFTPAYAAQSTITEADGNACMGDDKSRKQTEQAALADAKKRAVEFASTYIKSETQIKDFALEKDLLSAYANAEVKIIQELDKSWYKDPSSGDCCKIRIKAEIIPDIKAMEALSKNTRFSDDPSAPLQVKAWTDKKAYTAGEKIKVYIRGNKPFYARVLYKDAGGDTLQLLPNPYRAENYFNGGGIYEIPAGNDKFDLEVSPPFGAENVMVYASSTPLGEINVETRGAVYQVKTQTGDIGMKTRGVKLAEKTDSKGSSAASEFFEDEVVVKTGR
ncbi:MAG TPA: hypothetical protein DCS42_13315 [Nitrospiraceae bacterium]|nr:hypothetical protein [Nitrospiraceae bacterium]